MTEPLKIETLCAFDLLNHLNIEYGSTDYDYFIERLGKFRTEIEQELEAKAKTPTRIDENYHPRILNKEILPDGTIVAGRLSRMVNQQQDSNQRVFDNEEDIIEL